MHHWRLLLLAVPLMTTGCGTVGSVVNNPGLGPLFGGTDADWTGLQNNGFPWFVLDAIDLPFSLIADLLLAPFQLLF